MRTALCAPGRTWTRRPWPAAAGRWHARRTRWRPACRACSPPATCAPAASSASPRRSARARCPCSSFIACCRRPRARPECGMGSLPITLTDGYGVALVVVNVLLAQAGLPVPAMPTLIVAGALAGEGGRIALELFIGAWLACMLPDSGWFLAGRTWGGRVMKTLCRISINPDSCVSQTQLRFERWGPGALVVAKFVPGLSIIAPPLAGAAGMRWPRFLLLSGLSALLWVGVALAAGALLRPRLALLLPRMQHLALDAAIALGA